MNGLKLGKRLATQDDRDLLATSFLKGAQLPPAPKTFGHERIVKPDGWGMLGNDEWGDCGWAGPAHETMILTAEGSGKPVAFTTAGVLRDYTSTGFDPRQGPPGENPTDQGSDMRQVASYRRKKGIIDARGKRHKIGAYLKLPHDDPDVLAQAAHVFGVVGLGIAFPASAMDQFNAHEPWDVVSGSAIEGGHYIPYVARRKLPEVITWGRVQQVTPAFLAQYVDEAWAYVSVEALNGKGRSPEGLDVRALGSALSSLAR